MQSRVTKTPVLLFEELPADLRVSDKGIEYHSHVTALDRCEARSRGDSSIARSYAIPADGGYRCKAYQFEKEKGLCRGHYRRATPDVRERAAALYRRRLAKYRATGDAAL